jgi:hypothetical protein
MIECKKCGTEKPDTEFAICARIGTIEYRRRECKSCRGGTKPWGFEKRISEEERKKLIEHQDEFTTLRGVDFHEKVGLSMTLPTFYRYTRDGSFQRFYEKFGKKAQKP